MLFSSSFLYYFPFKVPITRVLVQSLQHMTGINLVLSRTHWTLTLATAVVHHSGPSVLWPWSSSHGTTYNLELVTRTSPSTTSTPLAVMCRWATSSSTARMTGILVTASSRWRIQKIHRSRMFLRNGFLEERQCYFWFRIDKKFLLSY